MTDDDINTLRKKLAKATEAMQAEALVKNAEGGERGGKVMKYATLNQVLELVKKHLADENLVMTQPFEPKEDGWQSINTLIVDKADGNFLLFPGPQMKVMNDPQAAGSAITYNRRYALVTLFALEQEDDDGAQAHRRVQTPNERTTAEKEVRQMIGQMSNEDRGLFVEDFRIEFGCTLSQLPESRHGDALGYTKFWITKPEGVAATDSDDDAIDTHGEAS